MKCEIKSDTTLLPRLLKKGGEKHFLQNLKSAQNKSLNAARKIAAQYIVDEYGLPRKSAKYGPASPYSRPSVKDVISTKLVSSIGGVQSGIPSKLFGQTKRLSTIRFLSSEKRPIQMKGIPVRKRKAITVSTGSQRTYRKKFVQRVKGRLHVFRSKKVGNRWRMMRDSLASVFSLLEKERVQGKMVKEAERKFLELI